MLGRTPGRCCFLLLLVKLVCGAEVSAEEPELYVFVGVSDGPGLRVSFTPSTNITALAAKVRASVPPQPSCDAACIEARLAYSFLIEVTAAQLWPDEAGEGPEGGATPRRRPLAAALEAVAANLPAPGDAEYAAVLASLARWAGAMAPSPRGDATQRLAAPAPDGLILEFGVATGSTARQLGAALPGARIVGFDSFTGLPEAWGIHAAGDFAQPLPEVPPNVELVVGRSAGRSPDPRPADPDADLAAGSRRRCPAGGPSASPRPAASRRSWRCCT